MTKIKNKYRKTLSTLPARSVLLLLLALLINIPCTFATSVLRMSLQDITAQASFIFYGKVVANEIKNDPDNNTVATYTTFRILDSVKGKTGNTYTIKQVGGHLPGSNQTVIAYGIPNFKIDQEYVVFLPKKSRIGFSSPVGLGQGSYQVYREHGIAKVQANREVLTHLAKLPPNSTLPKTSPGNNMRLTEFLTTIRHLAGKK